MDHVSHFLCHGDIPKKVLDMEELVTDCSELYDFA